MLRRSLLSALLLLIAVPSSTFAATSARALDRIVVVVNEDVITQHELDLRMATVIAQLRKRNTPLPDRSVLAQQVTERMIMETLLAQFAKESGLHIDDAQLDKTIARIAQQNKFPSVDAFRASLLKEGVNYDRFREEIRGEIISVRLREREIDSKLIISDNDINNYLENQARQASKGEELSLAHIFVVVPEQASADQIQARKAKAEKALSLLHGGASFAQVAAGFSDAPDALQGGQLGWRPLNRVPPLFAESLQKMQPGDFSPILRSPNGFHILKLQERRRNDAPVVITQTHARHILIKTGERMPENEARAKLQEIKHRIDKGADFAKEARLHSEDGSAAQGGDLGWLSPGETVPEFEGPMNNLKPGQISGLVQSGFGFHLIQVLERRKSDVSEEQKRQQARNAIRALKSDDAYQDWQRQLRDRAFIEYHDDTVR